MAKGFYFSPTPRTQVGKDLWIYCQYFIMKCPVTDRTDVVDDCYITIEFGFGSDKDLWTYKFHTIHDSVGKKVLEAIQSMMPEGKSVEDFGEDTMDEYFGGKVN